MVGWRRAGFFPQLGLILPCFLIPYSSYFLTSHTIAEEIRLLPTFRKHTHLLHEVQCPQQAAEGCGSCWKSDAKT